MVAGAAEVAVAIEDSYGTLPGTPTWFQPFVDMDSPDPSLDNQLTRQRQPDSTKSARSREGNVAGSVTLAGSLTDANIYDLVFPSETTQTYSLPDAGDLWPSATVYLSADVPGVESERFLQGVFPTEATIEYTQGEDIRMSVTCEYRSEDTSLTTPSAINQPDEKDAFVWHDMTPDRGGAEIAEMQSLTINIGNLARGRRNQSRFYTRAVAANHELGLSTEAIFENEETLELAYGAAAATETSSDQIEQTDYEITLGNVLGDSHVFTIPGTQPTSYDWSNLIGEEDLTEPVELHAADVSVDVTTA